MATVPPGPSNALPASPAEIPAFPGGGSAEPAGAGKQPACLIEECVPAGTGTKSQTSNEVKRSIKKKQKNMLARASPVPLHLKMQAREQQQLNGLVSPSEEPNSHQCAVNRADNPRSPTDNCDSSGSSDGTPTATSNSEHCQHKGHSPFSKNGSHSPLDNNSVNGIASFIRPDSDEGKDEFEYTQPPRPLSDEPPDTVCSGEGETEQQPPVAELARLHLNSSPVVAEESHGIRYVRYESELQMPWIMRLITKDLSEPYSIYTYRYFIHNWPQLCFLVSVFDPQSVHHVFKLSPDSFTFLPLGMQSITSITAAIA